MKREIAVIGLGKFGFYFAKNYLKMRNNHRNSFRGNTDRVFPAFCRGQKKTSQTAAAPLQPQDFQYKNA
jgi:3-hydroxyisobutyrate dehydrogenase-like beta-hydroxyacid dehydrogenase